LIYGGGLCIKVSMLSIEELSLSKLWDQLWVVASKAVRHLNVKGFYNGGKVLKNI